MNNFEDIAKEIVTEKNSALSDLKSVNKKVGKLQKGLMPPLRQSRSWPQKKILFPILWKK